jgi:hypothetical protein
LPATASGPILIAMPKPKPKINRGTTRPLSDVNEILRLIQNDWELGWSDGIRDNGRFWIQRGGLCKGGESRAVHASTARRMIARGWVVLVSRAGDPFWLRRYKPV